jgi:hypothetical protein
VSDILDFRRRLAAVVNDVLVGAVPAAEDALALADQARDLLGELGALREGHRPGTRRLVERVRRLEHDLRDRDPALRREIVCTRLGIGRSRYYELRRIAQSGDEVDCEAVASPSSAHGAR